MLGQALQTGMLETAAEGPFSWAAHEDLALAAARILTQETWTQGPTAPLTGPEALDFGALAQIATEVTGRAIRHEVLTDEAIRAKAEARGLRERVVGHMMGLYLAARRGEFATLDPTLEQLVARPLRTMRELIAASKPT